MLEDIAKAGAVLTVANATSASAIKAENVHGVSLSQCLQLVRYGSIGGDPRRTEISFCDHYDSRALSDLCRLCICGEEGVGPLMDLDRADLNSVTIAAKHQYESHLAFP